MLAGLFVALAVSAPAEEPPARLPTSPDTHKDAVARFGAAVWNLRRERLLTAARQLETVARQDPQAAEPWRELVRLYPQIGREPDAIRIARKLIERDPHDTEMALALARLLVDAGEMKEAAAVARIAAQASIPIERAESAVALYRELASIGEKGSEPSVAAAALKQAIHLLVDRRQEVIAAGAFTPKEADALAADCLERLGRSLSRAGSFAGAATAFESAAKFYADPRVNDPSAAARLAWNLSGAYQSKGEPATALKHLEAFLRLKPAAPEPYARLAQLLRELDRKSDAVPLLQRYLNLDPKNVPLQAILAEELARSAETRRDSDALFTQLLATSLERGIVSVFVRSQIDQGRPEQILSEIDRALAVLKPEKKEEVPVTKELLAAREFATEKIRVFGEILREDPRASVAVLRAAVADLQAGTKRTYQIYYFLGQLAARHGDLGLAAIQFQEAIRRAPRETQGDAYTGLIDVLRRAGKPALIARACRDGLQNAQDVAPVYFNYHLASALAELGDGEGALAAADKAIAQSGDSDRLTVRLQKVYVLRLLGNWDDAITLGKKLFEEFASPDDRLRTRYALAGAYWGAKKADLAEAELRAILDAEPDHAQACNELGFHLADQGRNLDEAERLIRTAIAASRLDRKKAGNAELDDAGYIDSLGWVLFRRGQLKEARVELERAVKLAAGAADPIIWDHLGDVLFRLGEKPKAKQAWEKAEGLYENESHGSSRGRRDGRLEELKRKLKRVP